MDYLISSLQEDWRSLLEFSPRLIYALILLLASWLAAALAARAIRRVFAGNERLRANERLVRGLAVWSLRGVGILLALGVVGLSGVATSLLATGGIVAIVLGFAFREVGENLLAGIFLAFSRPFELGDLIKTGGLTGTVRSVDIRSVHIRTADACDVFVPSAQIFRQELYNYTRDGLRRPDFTIGVAYHDQPTQVIAWLTDAAASIPDVLEEPAPMVTVEAFTASVVEYRVFFWIDTNRSSASLGEVSNAVKIRCWHVLRDAGATFATDVSTALEIRGVPEIRLTGAEE